MKFGERLSRSQWWLQATAVAFTVLSFVPVVMPTVPPDRLKIAGAMVALAWLVTISRATRPDLLWRDHPVVTAAASGLAVWALASVLWATDRSVAAEAARQIALSVALVVVLYTAARVPRTAMALIFAYISGAVLSIGYDLVFDPGPPTPGEFFNPGRLYGGIGDPNETASVLLPAIAFSLFSLPLLRRRSSRVLLGVVLVVLVVGLVLTKSRGGMVSAAVMLLAALLVGGRLKSRLAWLSGILLCATAGYVALFASTATRQRLYGALRLDDDLSDGSGRAWLWRSAADLITEHPIVGVGARNYRSATGEELLAHNTYLEIQVGLGVVGTLLFLTVAGAAIRVTVRAARSAAAAGERHTEYRARGILVALIGLVTSYLFISGEYQVQFWWLLGLALACPDVCHKRATSAQLSGAETTGTTVSRSG